MAELSSGDTVSWNTSAGKTHGKVVKEITKNTSIGGHTVKASSDNPQYEVESDKTGKRAVHKPDSLEKK